MQWVHFHHKLFLFRWISHPSTQIYHIKMVLKACEEVWQTWSVKDPPTQILIKLLTLVLKCSNFEFNGKHYFQIQGTVMCKKIAPSFANIFMGRLEKQLLHSVIFMAQVYRRHRHQVGAWQRITKSISRKSKQLPSNYWVYYRGLQ